MSDLELPTDEPLAVLCSSGVDSAVLLAEAVRCCPAVHPLYIRAGMAWEEVELAHLQRFLAAVSTGSLKPLVVLDQPIADVYGSHWSVTGQNVPDEKSPDEAVFLPGRNVLLLAKSLLWCHLNRVPAIALAPLAANSFPDATPEFFDLMARTVNQAVGGNIRILRPFARLTKTQVIMRAREVPLEHTFSCIRPSEDRHCGQCNKCAERQKAFREAGVVDPTIYSVRSDPL